MLKNKPTAQQGVTIIELMVTVAACAIIVVGIGVALVDSHKGWHKTYNLVYSDVVTDGYVARKAFDAVVRKSSRKRYELESNGDYVIVFYYQDLTSTELDRYARFYTSGGELMVDYGQLKPGTGELLPASNTIMLARNVTEADFSVVGMGNCVQMILTLDNDRQTSTVVCSAILHNE